MAVLYFPAVLTQAPGDRAVTIQVVDIPEAISEGRNPADAIARGQEALELALASRRELGEAIPPPSSLDDRLYLRLDAEQRREFKLFYLLPASEVEPAVRLNVSLPGDLVRRIDAVAGNYGRSGWLAEAAREKLARGQGLSDPGLHEAATPFKHQSRSSRPRPGRSAKRKRKKS